MRPEQGSVLILEDQFLLAMDLASKVEEVGWSVVGPYRNVESALASLGTTCPQAALLDINLGQGQTSEPVADKLQDLGVPFAFITGYSADLPLVQKFQDAPHSTKPVDLSAVKSLLGRLVPVLGSS